MVNSEFGTIIKVTGSSSMRFKTKWFPQNHSSWSQPNPLAIPWGWWPPNESLVEYHIYRWFLPNSPKRGWIAVPKNPPSKGVPTSYEKSATNSLIVVVSSFWNEKILPSRCPIIIRSVLGTALKVMGESKVRFGNAFLYGLASRGSLGKFPFKKLPIGSASVKPGPAKYGIKEKSNITKVNIKSNLNWGRFFFIVVG